MNEQTPSAAVAQAREAKAERLWQTLLDTFTYKSMPGMWNDARNRDYGSFVKDLQALCLHCYDAGYEDGFAEGEAIANEPDRNEGYE